MKKKGGGGRSPHYFFHSGRCQKGKRGREGEKGCMAKSNFLHSPHRKKGGKTVKGGKKVS